MSTPLVEGSHVYCSRVNVASRNLTITVGERFPAHMQERRMLDSIAPSIVGRPDATWRDVAIEGVVRQGSIVDPQTRTPIVPAPPAAKASDSRWRRSAT